ncbi:LysE family transporter [Campylobacter sp. 19-13652]|uniref:LysE family transporter n=1 Tax=Campylobacter sp. 19-13652 TaxID=2840180 RepID=UPI001C76E90E|nr:LysE family transporter [Campylobacter sp. 19-13652]BCX79317.1 threonine export protein RhtC [Campylobacter sp. 19-13652]
MLFTIALVHLLFAAIPGPDVLIMVRTGAACGFRAVVFAAAGIATGLILWVSLSVGLLASIAHTPLLKILMAVGGAYLIFIAFMLYKNGSSSINVSNENSGMSDFKAYMLGLSTNLANAKAIMYFAGIFSLAAARFEDSFMLWILGFVIVFESFLFFAFLGWVFALKRVRETFNRYRVYIDKFCAFLFVVFGLLIFYEIA